MSLLALATSSLALLPLLRNEGLVLPVPDNEHEI